MSSGRRLVGTGLLDARDDEAIERYLAVEMQSYPWISSMVLGRADGGTVYVGRAGDELESAVTGTGADRDPTKGALPAPKRASSPIAHDISEGFGPREQPWVSGQQPGGLSAT